ncbi:MAG TPA: hypothetical protein VK968_14775, partial [Roseimicrobium sp.]|nr:hypothetical protein [Roseimicrobium sp.]
NIWGAARIVLYRNPQKELPQPSMSALPPKPDIRHRIEHVCFVPEADIVPLIRAYPPRDAKLA